MSHWAKNCRCPNCGSTLVLTTFRRKHCFVCGKGHPGVMHPMQGRVEKLLGRINFHRKFNRIPPPLVLFHNGYAVKTEALRCGVYEEDTDETRKIRGMNGYE